MLLGKTLETCKGSKSVNRDTVLVIYILFIQVNFQKIKLKAQNGKCVINCVQISLFHCLVNGFHVL